MQRHFQRDIDFIHQRLLALSGMVEQMIDNAMRALIERKIELVEVVIASDDEIDESEVVIEEDCLKILALHQPVASDLRRIATVMKINSDLERIADLACNIAERAQVMCQYPYFPIPDDLQEMVVISTQMVRKALDSFVKSDSLLAKEVIQTDDQVDNLNRNVIKELTGLMQQDTSLVIPAMQCFSTSRHIERIGDHAENISEDVIYLVEGEIVRHKHGDFLSDKTDLADQKLNRANR